MFTVNGGIRTLANHLALICYILEFYINLELL